MASGVSSPSDHAPSRLDPYVSLDAQGAPVPDDALDLLTLLDNPYRAPPPLTCARVLEHTAQDSTQTFLSGLLPELRSFVDRLIATPAWHGATQLTPLRQDPSFNSIALGGGELAVSPTGERVLAAERNPDVPRDRPVEVEITRLDLPEGDPRRSFRVPGDFKAFVDLRPTELLIMVILLERNPRLTLYDLDGRELHVWAHGADEYAYDAVDYMHPWVRCNRQLCHIARRNRILLIPDSVVPHQRSLQVWGAEGAERLCATSPNKDTVRVFDLTTGTVLLQLSSERPKWRICKPLGILTHTLTDDHASARTQIYPLATGKPLVLSVARPYGGDIDGEVLLLEGEDVPFRSSFTYWSPLDPYRVRSIELGDWRFGDASGTLFMFVRGKQRLLWVWGAASAVLTDFEIPTYADNANLDVREKNALVPCNGAAFVAKRSGLTWTLHMLPLLSERTASGLPPPTLPQSGTMVSAVELYRGPHKPIVCAVQCSETHAPLVQIGTAYFTLD